MNGLAWVRSACEDGFEGGVDRAGCIDDFRPDQLARLKGGATDDPQRRGGPYATYRGGHFVLHFCSSLCAADGGEEESCDLGKEDREDGLGNDESTIKLIRSA